MDQDERVSRDFRMVHNEDECHQHTDHPRRRDNHLDYFIGPNGLQFLLDLLNRNGGKTIGDMSNFVTVMKRLHVPYFEEARAKFAVYMEHSGHELAKLESASVQSLQHIAEDFNPV